MKLLADPESRRENTETDTSAVFRVIRVNKGEKVTIGLDTKFTSGCGGRMGHTSMMCNTSSVSGSVDGSARDSRDESTCIASSPVSGELLNDEYWLIGGDCRLVISWTQVMIYDEHH